MIVIYVILISGIGLGLNSLSSHVMVNAYFHRRRGIAVGIVSSGAGFGVFVCAPLLQYLIKAYGWRGAVLVFSGVMAQFCVCAALMRPLEAPRTRRRQTRCIDEAADDSVQYEDEKQCDIQQSMLLLETIEENQPVNYTEKTPDVELRTLHNDDIDRGDTMHVQRRPGLHGWFMSTVNVSQPWNEISGLKSLPNIASHVNNFDKAHERFQKRKPHTTADHSSSGHLSSNHIYNQKYELLDTDNHEHHKKHLNPLRRKDIFYSSSLHHLPEFKKADSISSFMQSMIIPTDESSVEDDVDGVVHTHEKKNTTFNLLKSCLPKRNLLCDMSIFSNSVYIPMLLGGVFIQMGQFIPSTFIPKYCEIIGLDKDQVSTILSVFGTYDIDNTFFNQQLSGVDVFTFMLTFYLNLCHFLGNTEVLKF